MERNARAGLRDTRTRLCSSSNNAIQLRRLKGKVVQRAGYKQRIPESCPKSGKIGKYACSVCSVIFNRRRDFERHGLKLCLRIKKPNGQSAAGFMQIPKIILQRLKLPILKNCSGLNANPAANAVTGSPNPEILRSGPNTRNSRCLTFARGRTSSKESDTGNAPESLNGQPDISKDVDKDELTEVTAEPEISLNRPKRETRLPKKLINSPVAKSTTRNSVDPEVFLEVPRRGRGRPIGSTKRKLSPSDTLPNGRNRRVTRQKEFNKQEIPSTDPLPKSFSVKSEPQIQEPIQEDEELFGNQALPNPLRKRGRPKTCDIQNIIKKVRKNKSQDKLAHKNSEDVSNKFFCGVCKSHFLRRGDFLSHIASHESYKKTRFGCSLCKSTYHRKQSLDIHVLNQHTTLRPFLCHRCGAGFAIRPYLTRHLIHCQNKADYEESKASTNQQERIIVEVVANVEICCPLCNSKCSDQLALVNHMMKHKPNFPMREQSEDQQQDSSLVSLQTTGNKRKFVCKICKEEFPTFQTLVLHRRRHTTYTKPVKTRIMKVSESNGEETKDENKKTVQSRKKFMGIYKCNSCKYETKYWGSLNKHELLVHNRVVTAPKNTVSLPNFIHCQLCSYATRYKCNMQSHQKRIHNIGTGFQCEKCSFSAKTVSDLKNHQLQAHNVRPMNACKKCKVVFDSYHELKLHRMKHLRENTSCDANPLEPQPLPMDEIDEPPQEEELDQNINQEAEIEQKVEVKPLVEDSGKYLHACTHCDQKFARKHFLVKHAQCFHAEGNLDIGNDIKQEKASLPPENQITPAPIVVKREVPPHRCKLCGVICINDNALEMHLRRHR